MPRQKKPKTGVMPGFPKLAFYIGTSTSIRIPPYYNAWITNTVFLNPEELVVLVAEGSQYRYSRNINWNNIPVYYIVPVKALETGTPPITCIYSWKKYYKSLPNIDKNLVTIIEKDNGERITQAFTSV